MRKAGERQDIAGKTMEALPSLSPCLLPCTEDWREVLRCEHTHTEREKEQERAQCGCHVCLIRAGMERSVLEVALQTCF